MMALKSLAIGVVSTIPMIMPTQALAVIKAIPFCADLLNAVRKLLRQDGWSKPNNIKPSIPKNEEFKIDSKVWRPAIRPVEGLVQGVERKELNMLFSKKGDVAN